MASQTPRMQKAIDAIEEHGVLLVYPVQNKKEPLSLWHVLHPRVPMRWAWDENADPRVSAMWHLREQLARDRRVVYTKWLGGRATFFSLDLFRAMLATLRAQASGGDLRSDLAGDAANLLDALYDDSPQSTRALREGVGLGGRVYESAFTRAMRSLWERLLIVGVGEVEAGGFPALAVGATELLREDLWAESGDSDASHAELIERTMKASAPFARAFKKSLNAIRSS